MNALHARTEVTPDLARWGTLPSQVVPSTVILSASVRGQKLFTIFEPSFKWARRLHYLLFCCSSEK